MIYLASPYSHQDPKVMDHRFHQVAESAARLMAAGVQLFCPITHTHPIVIAGALPRGAEYWLTFDRWFIERCDAVVVVMIDGWEESVGVTHEIEMARVLGKPVIFVDFGWEVTKEVMKWKT